MLFQPVEKLMDSFLPRVLACISYLSMGQRREVPSLGGSTVDSIVPFLHILIHAKRLSFNGCTFLHPKI